MSILQKISTRNPDFDQQLRQLLALDATDNRNINTVVAEIVAAVAQRGDAALLDYTRRFEQIVNTESNTNHYFGVRFTDARDPQQVESIYTRFKDSLEQYAD